MQSTHQGQDGPSAPHTPLVAISSICELFPPLFVSAFLCFSKLQLYDIFDVASQHLSHLVHKANVEYILGLEEQEKTRIKEAERESAR